MCWARLRGRSPKAKSSCQKNKQIKLVATTQTYTEEGYTTIILSLTILTNKPGKIIEPEIISPSSQIWCVVIIIFLVLYFSLSLKFSSLQPTVPLL